MPRLLPGPSLLPVSPVAECGGSLVLSGEVPIGRMRSIGSQWIYNKDYRSLEQDMDTLMKVTPNSLRDLMKDFPFDPMTIVSLGPK